MRRELVNRQKSLDRDASTTIVLFSDFSVPQHDSAYSSNLFASFLCLHQLNLQALILDCALCIQFQCVPKLDCRIT